MPHVALVAAVGNLWWWCIILFARSSLTNCQTNLCLVWIFDRVHFKLLAPFLPHVFQHSTKSLSSGSKGHLHREEDPIDDQVVVFSRFIFVLSPLLLGKCHPLTSSRIFLGFLDDDFKVDIVVFVSFCSFFDQLFGQDNCTHSWDKKSCCCKSCCSKS